MRCAARANNCANVRRHASRAGGPGLFLINFACTRKRLTPRRPKTKPESSRPVGRYQLNGRATCGHESRAPAHITIYYSAMAAARRDYNHLDDTTTGDVRPAAIRSQTDELRRAVPVQWQLICIRGL